MTQTSTADRIERTDFPSAADGYDREAVDAHLRAIAAERAEVSGGDSPAVAAANRVRRIGDTAALRVEEIVGAAEQSAVEIIAAAEASAAQTSARAEAQARDVVARAEATARQTTGRADAEAHATRAAVEAAAAKTRDEAQKLAARATEAAERDAREAREGASAQADQLRQALDAAATLLERLGSATSVRQGASAPQAGASDRGPSERDHGHAEASERDHAHDQADRSGSKPGAARAASVWFSKGNRDDRGDGASEGDGRAARGSTNADGGSGDEHADRPHEMRMSAFNMLIGGTSRGEVVERLRERFGLGDEDRELLESVLDQASASATDWRPLPELPVRRRFLRR